MSLDVILIGGSGFIGSSICRRLQKNSLSFKILDKKKSLDFSNETILCDISKHNNLRESLQPCKTLINLAAVHSDDASWEEYHETNIKGIENIISLAEFHEINNIIFFSSVAVYGLNNINTNEESLVAPFNFYGTSKLEGEKLLSKWKSSKKDRNLQIIRPTAVFGPGNKGNVNRLIESIVKNKFLMIGSGSNKKSLAYVENISHFTLSILFSTSSSIYNYIDKPDFTMKELVTFISLKLNKKILNFSMPYFIGLGFGYLIDLISYLSNKKFSLSSIRVKKFCSNSIFESNYIGKKYNPPYTIKEGLYKTIEADFSEES
tara:strand:+ start:167 stop:1123 length:957 start_codon:yes stop_codon:yes gene_type:complete